MTEKEKMQAGMIYDAHYIGQPFYCDYGYNFRFGKNVWWRRAFLHIW